MSLRRALVDRIKRRLTGVGEPVPRGWDRRAADAWPELRDQWALCWQNVNTAFVASWEVAAAELHRALVAKGRPEAREWVARFSDALVPAQQPVVDGDRGVGKAKWTAAGEAAARSGHRQDATGPFLPPLLQLGGEVEAGWCKTVDFLAPVLDGLAVDVAGRKRLAAVGPALKDALDTRARALADALATEDGDFEAVVLDAIDVYRQGASQDVEVVLDQVRSVLVAAANASLKPE